MDKCNRCCPLKVIEDYKNLENDLSEEFARYIKMWFDEHPYVESVFVREDCPYAVGSMYLSSKKMKCTVKLKSK